MRPIDMLRRPVPKTEGTSKTIVRPPDIPPQAPPPRTGEYSSLMKKHDRFKSRHIKP
ncbi:MAG: hypothetical protein Q4D04_09610 [Clostridia bacterium]|nr:hypothetical protein [Clostridia bacterium]